MYKGEINIQIFKNSQAILLKQKGFLCGGETSFSKASTVTNTKKSYEDILEESSKIIQNEI